MAQPEITPHPEILLEFLHLPLPPYTDPSPRRNVQACLDAWTKLASTLVVAGLTHGFALPFSPTQPPRIRVPNYPLTPAQINAVRRQVAEYLLLASVGKVTEVPWVVSPLFTVPKASGGFRVVIDLRRLNEFLSTPKFRNESVAGIARVAARFTHATTVDIHAAFHHVPVYPGHRKFLGFQLDGEFYVWNVFPFGCQTSPWAWHLVMAEAIRLIRLCGVVCVWYVDDMMVLGSSAQHATASRAIVLCVLRALGLRVNDKGIATPSPRVPFLGFDWDLEKKTIAVMRRKREAVRVLARQILNAGGASVKLWQSLVGKINSLTPAVAVAPLYTRPIHNALSGGCRAPTHFVPLTPPVREVLAFWRRFPLKWTSRRIDVPATLTTLDLTFDASSFAWGAFLHGRDQSVPLEARGFFTNAERPLPPVYRETIAFVRALESFPALWCGPHNLLLRTDSQPLAAAIRRTSSPSMAVYRALATTLPRLWAQGTVIRVQWIKSEYNEADAPSRHTDPEDYALATCWVRVVTALFQVRPTVDRFASAINARCLRFNSATACPRTEAINALARLWRGEENWANPPFSLLLQVLLLILEQGAATTLITPIFPERPWWPLLIRMATAVFVFPADRPLFSRVRCDAAPDAAPTVPRGSVADPDPRAKRAPGRPRPGRPPDAGGAALLSGLRATLAHTRVLPSTLSTYHTALRALPFPPPFPFASAEQLSVWLLTAFAHLARVSPHAVAVIARAWPALQHVQRCAGGSIAPFLDHDVLDILVGVRRFVPSTPTRRALPPTPEMINRLLNVALNPGTAELQRRVALAAVLQFVSVQRPSVVRTLRVDQLKLVDDDYFVLCRHHKTQPAADKHGHLLDPTPPIRAPSLIRVWKIFFPQVYSSTPAPLLLPGCRSPHVPLSQSAYAANLVRLWVTVGAPLELALRITPHGIRRGGVHAWYAAGASFAWLGQVGPWATARSMMPYLPPEAINILGLAPRRRRL